MQYFLCKFPPAMSRMTFSLTTTGYQGKQEPFPDIITAKARGLFSKQLYHVML